MPWLSRTSVSVLLRRRHSLSPSLAEWRVASQRSREHAVNSARCGTPCCLYSVGRQSRASKIVRTKDNSLETGPGLVAPAPNVEHSATLVETSQALSETSPTLVKPSPYLVDPTRSLVDPPQVLAARRYAASRRRSVSLAASDWPPTIGRLVPAAHAYLSLAAYSSSPTTGRMLLAAYY